MKIDVLLACARTLLILGRVSNLPTVWSNLVVGWILNRGGFDFYVISMLLAGGSALYIGGMYLNDFCDAEFDARYCPHRPIPAVRIRRATVGKLATVWLVAGFILLAMLGYGTAGVALVLVAAIVGYDFRHKENPWAPFVMGSCRLLLYVLGAVAATANESDQFFCAVIPAGLGLGFYVVGITYLARGESRPDRRARWAVLLLLLPIVLALGLYDFPGTHPHRSIIPLVLVCMLQMNWLIWVLVPFWRRSNPSLGRVVSGLLAGIVMVDMVAATEMIGPFSVALFPLFVFALLLQRLIPAT